MIVREARKEQGSQENSWSSSFLLAAWKGDRENLEKEMLMFRTPGAKAGSLFKKISQVPRETNLLPLR